MSIFNDNDVMLDADKTLVFDWFKRNSDYRLNELNFDVYVEDDVIKTDILKNNGVYRMILNNHPEKIQGFVLNKCDVDLFCKYMNFQDIPSKCLKSVFIYIDPFKLGEFEESLKNTEPKSIDLLCIRIEVDKDRKSLTSGDDIYMRSFIKKFKKKYTERYFKKLGVDIRQLMIYG